jgi:predicted O-methyltransferase YrrM
VKEEIRQLLKVLQETRARVVVEIGTWQGGTLFLFARVAQPNAIIISVDLPRGPFGAGYPQWKAPLYESFAEQGQKIYLVRGDSHDPRSLHEVMSLLNGEAVDLLFIDGDHAYEGVKKDFEMYKGLLRDGGIVAFHDICRHPPETLCEVSRFWNEIKSSHRYMEIVKDWNQGNSGIGVIYL